MAVKNTAQVVIDGKIITLGGYESEEYFQKVAAYMNNKISELSQMPGYSRQAMETKHTLLSLNITDDYFKAKKQAEIFEQETGYCCSDEGRAVRAEQKCGAGLFATGLFLPLP